jgi:hypothetical protein
MPRLTIRILSIVLSVGAAVSVGASAKPAAVRNIPPAISNAPTSVTELPPEVRLRRLHLMRPDLIPYPLAYEVIC